MEVKNLFDSIAYSQLIERLHTLSPDSQRQWGKMQVAQMLAHCKEAFKIPLTDIPLPRIFLGSLLGWTIKSKLYNESAWKQAYLLHPILLLKMNGILRKKKQPCWS